MIKFDRNTKKAGDGKSEPDLKTVRTAFNEGVGDVVSFQSGLIAKNHETIASAKKRLSGIRSTLDNSEKT